MYLKIFGRKKFESAHHKEVPNTEAGRYAN
jgi:hypothetical protein